MSVFICSFYEEKMMSDHDDFGGLTRDMAQLSRRRALTLLGGLSSAALLAACGKTVSTADTTIARSDTSSPTTSTSQLAASAGAEIPNETQGPFPADGSNGPNVLKDDGVVKRDITTSFGEFSGTASGVATTVNLLIVDATTGAAISNAAVYAWHCTADGRYSIYEISNQNYLRGLQTSDDAGLATFTTIFPGCYRGRWPHIHFEIYSSLNDAKNGSSARKISQLAIPEAACQQAYKDSAYSSSVSALAAQSLTSDMVFRDGWNEQLATVTGSNADGWTMSLVVRI